jgi:hypothetical protein
VHTGVHYPLDGDRQAIAAVASVPNCAALSALTRPPASS